MTTALAVTASFVTAGALEILAGSRDDPKTIQALGFPLTVTAVAVIDKCLLEELPRAIEMTALLHQNAEQPESVCSQPLRSSGGDLQRPL